MPIDERLNTGNIQQLVGTYEAIVGLTRLTKTTISEGPEALNEKVFKYQITRFIQGIKIFESLDSAYRTAELIIEDPVSWRAIAPFTGQEVISIAYKNALSGSDSKLKIINFMVHKIYEEGVQTAMQAGFKKLIVRLVEFPAFKLLMSNQVYKTYPIDEQNTPKQRFSDLVKDTLNSIKDFSKWYNIEIEDSIKDSVNFYIPNWIPMKVINFCKKYAISEKKNYPMYVFHIGNKYGDSLPTAYFKPVYSFVDDTKKIRVYGTTFQEVGKRDLQNKSPNYNPTDTIQGYGFEYFDAQRSSMMSGNTEAMFDYLNDNKYISSDYDKFLLSKYKGLNAFVTYPFSAGNQWSSFNRSPWNSKEGSMNVKSELHNEYVNNIMQGGLVCKTMCFIYEGRQTGERAELKFNINDKDSQYDKMMSGAWITWDVIDSLANNISFSSVVFRNDGFIELKDPTNTYSKINTITSETPPENLEQG